MGIGTVLLCQGSWAEATEAFQKAAQLLTEGAGWSSWKRQTAFALGRTYLVQEKQQEALRLFEEQLALARRDSPGFAGALAGLQEAYDNLEEFYAFCDRFEEKHPRVSYSPLVQWYLEPAEAYDFPESLIHDEFIESLSSDWIWQDQFDECSFTVGNGLEIHAANGRDLWDINLSAPRILRQASGDFAAQTVCVPASEEKPAMGGVLLWVEKENYLRLDRGARGRYEINFSGCIENKDLVIGRGRLPAERVFLRLERHGSQVNALCSADGVEWFTVGHVNFPVEDPVEVGLHAIGDIDRTIYHGAYPDGTAIRFQSFRLWTN
jgi:tetratricopeptide (TPR) repeat protein